MVNYHVGMMKGRKTLNEIILPSHYQIPKVRIKQSKPIFQVRMNQFKVALIWKKIIKGIRKAKHVHRLNQPSKQGKTNEEFKGSHFKLMIKA
jgi:hypothetical protein